MTDISKEYIALWKEHGIATQNGEYTKCNHAMKKLLEIFKKFEADRNVAKDVLSTALQSEDPAVASGAAAHCLSLDILIAEAERILRQVSANTPSILALNAEMALTQWREKGYLLMYPDQAPRRHG